MERKIGEIFEYDGEWYQCVKSPDESCKHCDMNFSGKCPIPIKECVASARSDLFYVVFKKLEKVGEPTIINRKKVQLLKSSGMRNNCIYCCFLDKNSSRCLIPKMKHENETFYVEIKQKEDMEEKKLNLKPFDVQKAREGKPVCTRDGRKARIICFDAKGNKPLIILSEIDGKEVILRYTEKGQSDNFHSPTPREDDLMMCPVKKEGWVNVYKRENEYICENECNVFTGITVFKSEGEAKRHIDKNKIYANTIKISWEE